MRIVCVCGKKREAKQPCQHCKVKSKSPQRERKRTAYNLSRWKTYANRERRNRPLCAHCQRTGKVTSIHPDDGNHAGCVDHIESFASENDPKFMDTYNHQGLCWECHAVKTRLEVEGKYTTEMIERDKLDRQTLLNESMQG